MVEHQYPYREYVQIAMGARQRVRAIQHLRPEIRQDPNILRIEQRLKLAFNYARQIIKTYHAHEHQ